MRILAFDTAAPTNTVGLVDDDRLLADYAWEARDNSLQRIVLNIDQVLKRGGVALEDIEGLAVGIGPGSWTGAKVGVTVAKTLAYAVNKPVCGVTSLEALAYQCRTASVQICPLVDAGKENVYGAFYRPRGKSLVRKGDFYVGDIKGLVAAVKEPTLFLGKPAHLYRRTLARELGPLASYGSPSDSPSGCVFAWIALPRFRKGDSDDALALAPLYLKESLAQALLLKRQQEDSGKPSQ
ncbi:MAG: tRNA (adenosine(37)-N6)-threonylcarbamoyltransferase complex dimerization subunit type 1 TsaB [Dehalococcoidia bacterium]|nr:tRNA (adenosine(37)-N6)-threonylcarbamoyltransferase complex dimerization subunit type 1 TsaB [Dehalococcoidia bacterium]